MLHILAGPPGELWEPLSRQLRGAYEGGGECLLLVPEQYTLQAEKDLIRELGVPGFFRLQVLSPSRLYQRIMDRLGSDPRTPIDARGRNMAVARALVLSAGQLRYYRSAAGRQGFAERMASLVSSFKEAGVSPETLRQGAREAGEESLAAKLSDVAEVYERYEALLSETFSDKEDLQADMLARLARGRPYAGCSVFVYGFDAVREPLARLLLCLSAQADSVLLALPVRGEEAPDGEAFAHVRKSLKRLEGSMEEAGLPVRTRWLPPPARTGALAHLERHLLAARTPVYQGPCQEIRLFAARTPHGEAAMAARLVLEAMREGTPLSRIAVYCARLDSYSDLLASAFEEHRIPFYIADRTPVASHALVRFLLSALRCVTDGWRREDVLEMVKSGFSGLSWEEGFVLENFAVRFGISGRRWLEPFSWGDPGEAEAAEGLRRRLVTPVETLRRGMARAETPARSLGAVMDFLEETGAHGRILALERELAEAGMPVEAARTRQVWTRLSGLFEQMHALMDDKRIPIRYFGQWLEAGLSGDSVASLPPEAQSVQCGEIGQLMVRSPSLALVLGLNDGALAGTEEALLTGREAEAAEGLLNIRMEGSAKAREETALLDLLRAFSSPSRNLVLSWALADEEGKTLRPLSWVGRVKDLFPGAVEESDAGLSPKDPAFPGAPLPALDAIAPLLRSGPLPGLWEDAWSWLCADPKTRPLARALAEAAGGDSTPSSLPPTLARELFETRTSSVSRLETFVQCPFRHFVLYGLRAEKQPLWQVTPEDAGRFFHEALAAFTASLPGLARWPRLERQENDAAMDAAMGPLRRAWDSAPFGDSARSRAESEALAGILRRIAWTLTSAACHSDFRPDGQEVRFGWEDGLPGVELTLPDGFTSLLHGVIDRVDSFDDGETRWLRVVDYKSSSRALEAARIWWGLQLQLLLYLRAASGVHAGARPAGTFYQLLDDPLARTDDPSRAEQEILKSLRLNGLSVDAPELSERMDSSGGLYLKASPRLSPQEMDLLLNHAVRAAAAAARGIREGRISPVPAVSRNGRGPCDWCEFAGVCRRDPLRSRPDRVLPRMDFKELISRLDQGEQSDLGFPGGDSRGAG